MAAKTKKADKAETSKPKSKKKMMDWRKALKVYKKKNPQKAVFMQDLEVMKLWLDSKN